ncbi:uncharacterized protein N7473_009270 [Penicillium subrubescens]|uniref:uncharacterized protein n=1 Tax=Penicillium subrubescens TaxID=1316194 RepID=UPI002544E4DB|nr:uncharacterized protein N7473_009270 [Penicillium subrubescens]KAJ5886596.1 hypothetical protein N7473_009270 [Penicillium subrubescens]
MEALGHSVDSNVLWRTTTLRKNEIEVYYHATGKCYTTQTKTEVATGVNKILHQISNNDYYASCWGAALWSRPVAWTSQASWIVVQWRC